MAFHPSDNAKSWLFTIYMGKPVGSRFEQKLRTLCADESLFSWIDISAIQMNKYYYYYYYYYFIIIIIIIILAYFVLSLILPFQKDRNSSFVSKCKVPTNQLCTSKMRKTGFVYVAVIAPCQTIWCKLSKIVEKWNDAATFLYPHCISHP